MWTCSLKRVGENLKGKIKVRREKVRLHALKWSCRVEEEERKKKERSLILSKKMRSILSERLAYLRLRLAA